MSIKQLSMVKENITPKQVNQDFSIMYWADSSKGRYKFISCQQFIQILGEQLTYSNLEKMYARGKDEYVIKPKHGIKFKFQSR